MWVPLVSLGIVLVSFLADVPAPAAEAKQPGAAVVLTIDGAIGPATADYVERGIAIAREKDARLVVLRMDTPGGLDTAMRDIIRAIIGAPMPVATWVAPSGARAASAGTYILYASPVAAMAPGTNLGAATPIQVGGLPTPGGAPEEPGKKNGKKKSGGAGGKPGLEEKILNDAAAYIRSLAELRGRNADWAESAVRKAASLPATDAAKQNVVDFIAADLPTLLAKADGRKVIVNGRTVTVASKGLTTEEIPPDWRDRLLSVITDPNVAYILMLLGVYGLVFEFLSPGAIAPGVLGGISLLLALYALNVLPVNYAGLGLVILGIALMAAEAAMPSFGILGIGGTAAFVIGSVILFNTGSPVFELSWAVIADVALSTLVFFLLVVAFAIRAWRRRVVSGAEQLVGSPAEVVEWTGRKGTVRAHGELWQARASRRLRRGQQVRISALEGLTLEVEPDTGQKET